MSRTGAALAAGVLVVAAVTPVATSATAADLPDPIVGQAEIDGSAADHPNWPSGGWADATGGVAARPFVTGLTISNGGVSTPVISGGTAGGVPTSLGGSDLTAVVTPLNVCKPGQSDRCYPSPNRVQVTLAYVSGGQLHYDLSRRDPAAVPAVTRDSVIDLQLGLNTTGASLGWTWANGSPSYWRTQGLGTPGGTVQLRFTPGLSPQMSSWAGAESCSTIPVSTCNAQQAGADFLVGSALLSLDTTLGPEFSGALFATDGAIIGSLETRNTPNGTQLQYGAASTHLTPTGEPRTGQIKAFLSQAMLTDLGVTGDPGDQLLVERTNGPGSTGTITWTPWSAADQGSTGYLVTIPGITFSAPVYTVTPTSATPTRPKPAVRAGSAQRKSVLVAKVTPKRAWRVRAEVRRNGQWRVVARGTTSASGTWRKNLPKGSYRVVVPAQSGSAKAVSSRVSLRR